MAIVYVTTNKINGRKYLGKRVEVKPSYLGSGVALKLAVNKYGKHNFIRRTLCVVETKEEAARIEKHLSITWNVVDDRLWYNMKIGGEGGGARGGVRSPEHRRKISETLLGHQVTPETRDRISYRLTGIKTGPRPTLRCPHCNRVGGIGNMQRWHFDNCKWRIL